MYDMSLLNLFKTRDKGEKKMKNFIVLFITACERKKYAY